MIQRARTDGRRRSRAAAAVEPEEYPTARERQIKGYARVMREAEKIYEWLARTRYRRPPACQPQQAIRFILAQEREHGVITEKHGADYPLRVLLEAVEQLYRFTENNASALDRLLAALKQDVVGRTLLKDAGYCRHCRRYI